MVQYFLIMAAVLLLLMMANPATTTTITPKSTSAMSTNQTSTGDAIKAAQTRHNRIFGAYVLILVLTVLGTYLVWNSGNKVQDAVQADADARIAQAKATSDQADARSKKLENDNLILSGNVAGLQKNASDAKTAQQKVEIELGKQQERAANAEKELLRLQANLADRTLSLQQQSFLTNQMKPWAGLDIDVLIWGDTPEIEIISGQILKSLAEARWHLHTGRAGGGGAVRGILIGTRSDADGNTSLAAAKLISVLQSAGLASGPWKFEDMNTPPIMFMSSFTGKAPIRLFIGSKPPN